VIRRLSLVLALGGSCLCQSSAPPGRPLVADRTIRSSSETMVAPNVVSPGVAAVTPSTLGLPPLPAGKATLIGGTIESVDLVRDRVVIQIFAGRRMAMLFDERTHIFRDGEAGTFDDLRKGQRTYVDTMLDGKDIFARTIRIVAQGPLGESSGQIVDFDSSTGDLVFRDTLSPEEVVLHVASDAKVLHGDQETDRASLRPGTLVSLHFNPEGSRIPTVHQIQVIAATGATFTFAGRIEHLDMRQGLLVLVDPRDNKSYDLHFDPSKLRNMLDLRPGLAVTVQASFDGKRYESKEIQINPVR